MMLVRATTIQMFSCQIISQWSDNVLALGPVDAGKYNKQFSYKEYPDGTFHQQEEMKYIFPFQIKNIYLRDKIVKCIFQVRFWKNMNMCK